MYAYRYRHLKKKKINGAVWLGGLLLAVIGILLQTNRSFFAKLGEEGAKSCCEKVLDFYLPGLSYSVKDETEWSFVEKVIDVLFSGENYEPESGSYQTQIESDLSYEAILAREAADENYRNLLAGACRQACANGQTGKAHSCISKTKLRKMLCICLMNPKTAFLRKNRLNCFSLLRTAQGISDASL